MNNLLNIPGVDNYGNDGEEASNSNSKAKFQGDNKQQCDTQIVKEN